MERIVVKNIFKKFRKDQAQGSTLYKIISMISQRNSREKFYALDNISLRVERGEVVGIIGENGSGKSTLLRMIAGIYKPDYGEIKTEGNIVSIIDLATAMQYNSTMTSNIYLCATFLGLDGKKIHEKFSEIVEFSGLKDFVNTRIYKFSNGMVMRLMFSIAIHCNPEILLLDEVFEVGDEEFKKKSGEKIRELIKKGCSVVLVGHDLASIEKQCDRVIWMDKGKIKMEGKPKKIIEFYKKHEGNLS